MKRTALGLALILCAMPAHAKDIARVHDATFTDERGQCPRLHRVAKRADLVRGCWTIGEHSREIVVTWDDGLVYTFTEMQFEIYGSVL